MNKNTAKSYARRQEMIANMVYGGRMGNGDKNSGDGWRYKGRGFIQLTGKINYKAFGDYIGVNVCADPNLIAIKYPLSSAAWYFEKRKIWQVCDEGIDIETIKKVTKLVNGGYNGLEDRISKTNIFYKLIV